jgi:hypothetical protein
MRKMNGKGTDRLPSKTRENAFAYNLSRKDLKRGMELGARIDREFGAKMLIYTDESIIVPKIEKKWWE